MRFILPPGTRALCVIVVVLLLAGCGTVGTSNLTVLSTITAPAETKAQGVQGPPVMLAVGAVGIPSELIAAQDRVRGSRERSANLSTADIFDAAVAEDIPTVFRENLSILLAPYGVKVVRWGLRTPGDYRIELDLKRFEATERGEVILQGAWSLLGRDRETPVAGKDVSLLRPLEGKDSRARADTMSLVLGDLSRDVASAIGPVVAGTGR